MRTVAPGDELLVSRVQANPSSYQGKAASLGVLVAGITTSRSRLSSNTCGVGARVFPPDRNDPHSLGRRLDCLTVLPYLWLECTSS